MITKLTIAGIGAAAAAIILSPIASADGGELTNVEVAGGGSGQSSSADPRPIIVTATRAGSGGGQAYWAVLTDPSGKPYTDANGNLIKRCISHCGSSLGVIEAKTGCGNSGWAVNEVPKPPPADDNDDEPAQPASDTAE